MKQHIDLYENQKLFGQFILKLRLANGWSRAFVAKKLGFNSESSIMNFETGHTVMRPKHISRFCKITPNKLTVPVLFAMFEAGSLKAPCRCVCHHDMNSIVPNIYDEDGHCRLCDHGEGDCRILNGLWFESNSENFYDQTEEAGK